MPENDNTYKTLLESTQAIPWKIDWESKLFSYIGPQIEQLLGWPQDSWVSAQDWIDRIHEKEREETTTYCISQSMAGIDHEADYRALKADGGYVWVRDVVHVIRENGETKALIGFMFDITERKLAENRLSLANKVFLHTHEGILITDACAIIIDTNQAFTRITGYDRDDVLGKNPKLLQSGHQNEDFYFCLWQSLLNDGSWSGEIWNRKKSGELYAAWQTISAVKDSLGNTINYVGLFSDITQIKNNQRKIEHMAYHDTLTRLPNRLLLMDRLSQAIVQNKRIGRTIAVAYLDLDGFKSVNDNYGHQAGDTLLKNFAHRMDVSMRDGDTLSRIGGDEFVALLVNLEQGDNYHELLDRLLKTASSAVAMDHGELKLSVSIGVSVCPDVTDDPELLLRYADKAMYKAKKAEKIAVVYLTSLC